MCLGRKLGEMRKWVNGKGIYFPFFFCFFKVKRPFKLGRNLGLPEKDPLHFI
jgi:hypothetical protein